MSYIKKRGFSLIEILVMVTIIAILTAIAIPNFLAAQTQSKVSKVVADMKILAMALEIYRVDYNRYPLNTQSYLMEGIGGAASNSDYLGDSSAPTFVGLRLTTPISYVSCLPSDPFSVQTLWHLGYWFGSSMTYNNGQGTGVYWYGMSPTHPMRVYWELASYGPDGDLNQDWRVNADWPVGNWLEYDPTNGTVSDGNITRISGNRPGIGYF